MTGWRRWLRELAEIERRAQRDARRLEGLAVVASTRASRVPSGKGGAAARIAAADAEASLHAARASLLVAREAMEAASMRASSAARSASGMPRQGGYQAGVRAAREYSALVAIREGRAVRPSDAVLAFEKGLLEPAPGAGAPWKLTPAGWIALGTGLSAAALQALKQR